MRATEYRILLTDSGAILPQGFESSRDAWNCIGKVFSERQIDIGAVTVVRVTVVGADEHA